MGLDWGMTANGYRFLFKGDENVLELIVMVAHSCEYTRKYYIIHLYWFGLVLSFQGCTRGVGKFLG